jgi:hypothetical protein
LIPTILDSEVWPGRGGLQITIGAITPVMSLFS